MSGWLQGTGDRRGSIDGVVDKDKGTFGGDGNVLYLDCGTSYMGLLLVRTHRSVHLG